MLLGEYRSKLSDKGRVALPSRFQKDTGNNLIVARWYEGCLVVVGAKDWDKLLARMTTPNELLVKPVRSVDRFILASAYEANLDKQRRFVIPATLRGYAGLKEKVVFIGLGDRIEIWNEEAWVEEEGKVKRTAEAMIEKIAKARNI